MTADDDEPEGTRAANLARRARLYATQVVDAEVLAAATAGIDPERVKAGIAHFEERIARAYRDGHVAGELVGARRGRK